ncbi:diaminobutyrate--2-oxoglutarate transaminase EctB [Janthinobacterium sp. HH01]|uniref:diaminobutyrate--2-oxoglutarate transaminase n=1 Tax=Janthinobacterium sp. HH01 TaxID=1198452 RepID=UPI0002AEA3C6|nr:diaminobutyrate--2-oxoglutarate transaminase [Janthinobacterium sp. HH01]ELX13933.1 diaminobutyrate--2-oxoglutarate transaminase EctB [Janthinobacterium sp. HH01]
MQGKIEVAGMDVEQGSTQFQEFERHESNVRSYCRDFPALFFRAKGSEIFSVDQQSRIDFFMGAGALNYGHNSEPLKRALLAYIEDDGISHSLDFYTQAKQAFIVAFQERILQPRGLRYKLQFTGPTGTNAVEAALKLARKVTGRTNVIAFSNAFHGMSLGSLAVTASPKKRQGAGLPLTDVAFMPYDGYLGDGVDSIDYIERMLAPGSGIDAPAAFIVETIQGEGGLRYASAAWMRRLAALAQRCGALLVVDDIQSGCGRSGRFFSFEEMDIVPDIVCLSKSLSGYGTPLSVNLIKPQHDIWEAGEHNGTFRGNNQAFVTAKAAIDEFWRDRQFEIALGGKIAYLTDRLERSVARILPKVPQAARRGRGFMQGIAVGDGELSQLVSQLAFQSGLIAETCGVNGEVVKLLPALTIDDRTLANGLDLLDRALDLAIAQRAA